jgi:hypothetical protein
MNAAVAPLVRPLGSIDGLETSLIQSWHEVTRATHHFLTLLREFDLRQGWRSYGLNDCAEWLNWKCGIARGTATEKVRVARALWFLPQIDEAFRRGDLSYSKVRALTRVATDTSETDLLDFALKATAAQVEDRCRRLRNGNPATAKEDARHLHASRALVRHFREDGSGTLSVELPRDELELVLQALELIGSRLPEDPSRALFARGADALVQMARETLAGGSDGAPVSDAYQVVVHVDASALSGNGGESDLPLPAVKRLCCDGTLVALIEDGDGAPLNVGRRQRTLSTALKRALRARDRHCTWPGCHHERFVEAHHIHHWADGGETSLANLTLLCSAHHKLLHEGGYSMERRGDGTFYFARPDRRPVEELRRSYRVGFSAGNRAPRAATQAGPDASGCQSSTQLASRSNASARLLPRDSVYRRTTSMSAFTNEPDTSQWFQSNPVA